MRYTRLTFSPQAFTASPAARIFLAALWSRSWCDPHSGHSHERTANGKEESVYPQPEQRFEDGKNWSMATSDRPAHSALYASWRTNSPQLASAIAFASLGLRIMFFTFKDSTHTTWFSLISVRDSLCKLSCRQSEILA